MPRRKRTGDEGGRRAKIIRVEPSEEPLVISDSEHEEDDCTVKRSSRTARWKRREDEAHLRDMTEDQMLALAMRLSAQEANTVAQRQQQLEDSDIQKAIEESLNESTVKTSEGHEDEAGSSDQPQPNVANAIPQLRRKLHYSSQDQAHSDNDRESTSPLPDMPDLSQTISSPLSSKSSAQISGPPASAQNKTSDKQTDVRDTPELFKSLPESQSSPFFTRCGSFSRQPVVYVEKLSQELISASTDSVKFGTQDSTIIPICADGAHFPEQQDSPLSKCPAFKRGVHSLEDKDESNVNGNEDETQIPDEDAQLPTSQGSNTDPDTCLSPLRSSQPSSPKCVPENNKEDKTHDLKQEEAQTTQDVKSATETAPNTQSWNEFKSHMVLHLTDDDEDDGSEEVLSPSPAQEKSFRPIKTQLSPTLTHVSSSTITLNPSTQDTQMSRSILEQDLKTSKDPESKAPDCKPPCSSEEKAECHISYYWGVPFCPKGQNPDEYTRVIMCQMEVYEKSLKEAQRELLRKADWGHPVFPGSERPFGVRRWKRHRPPQLSEDEEENEEEKENNTIEVEEEKEEAREEPVAATQEDAEGGQNETYVVLSSPETKDEKADEAPFFNQKEPVGAAANKPFRKTIPWDLEEAQTHRPPEQEEEETQIQEDCEEDEMVCPETQMTENSTPELMMTSPASPAQPQSRADSEVMEVEEGGGGAAAEEEVMMEQESDPAGAAPPQVQRVECPMCSKLFPLHRIEVHAALCDGEADLQEEQSQVVVRRKRTRRNVTEEAQWSDRSAQMEKCFLCQGLFSSNEYPIHVNLCFEKRNSKTNQQENSLLSALDRTERRQTGVDEPGPSDVSTDRDRGLADPVVTGTSTISERSTTSCPNNSYDPQSENTVCLTDFCKNSQRLSRKRKFKR